MDYKFKKKMSSKHYKQLDPRAVKRLIQANELKFLTKNLDDLSIEDLSLVQKLARNEIIQAVQPRDEEAAAAARSPGQQIVVEQPKLLTAGNSPGLFNTCQ